MTPRAWLPLVAVAGALTLAGVGVLDGSEALAFTAGVLAVPQPRVERP